MYYDASTSGVVPSGKSLVLQSIDEKSDIVFKASFIILDNIKCAGTVTALFDLIVLGDIDCDRLDVKGRFICLGTCMINDMAVVQNEVWVNDISSGKITCHDRIFAREMDVDVVKAEGNILVGKTLAVSDSAESFQNIICGETAYGAGKLIANTIVTAEELDMDDGEEALKSPYVFTPHNTESSTNRELEQFVRKNDYEGFFNYLRSNKTVINEERLERSYNVFKSMNLIYPDGISKIKDVTQLLWLFEVANSDYFLIWPQVRIWINSLTDHFDKLIHGREINKKSFQTVTELNEGNVVLHSMYGKGIVTKIVDKGKYAKIEFEDGIEKEFPLPNSLKFFKLLQATNETNVEDNKKLLSCNLSNYDEWISALSILNDNKKNIGEDLYAVIYDLLLAEIGLKSKFINDRLQEKGWN